MSAHHNTSAIGIYNRTRSQMQPYIRSSDSFVKVSSLVGKFTSANFQVLIQGKAVRMLITSLRTLMPDEILVDAQKGKYGGTWLHPRLAVFVLSKADAQTALRLRLSTLVAIIARGINTP